MAEMTNSATLSTQESGDTDEKRPLNSAVNSAPASALKSVYVSPTVTRISNISEKEESFRVKFSVFFAWEPTAHDLSTHPLTAARFPQQPAQNPTEAVRVTRLRAGNDDAKAQEMEMDHMMQKLINKLMLAVDAKIAIANNESAQASRPWEPQWKPTVRFPNEITRHAFEWQSPTGEQNVYEMRHITSAKDAYMICSTLVCDITFSEEFELEGLPFDCQDLSIMMESVKSQQPGHGNEMRHFVLEPIASLHKELAIVHKFSRDAARVMPEYSPIMDVWCLVGLAIEFYKQSSAPQCVLSVKLQRNWQVIMWNQCTIIFALALASMSVFAIECGELVSRLSTGLGVVLATLVFDTKTPVKPYRTLMDKYMFSIYSFQFAIMLMSVTVFWREVDDDSEFARFAFAVFILIHVAFIIAGWYRLEWEREKVSLSFDQVRCYLKEYSSRKMINIEHLTTPNATWKPFTGCLSKKDSSCPKCVPTMLSCLTSCLTTCLTVPPVNARTGKRPRTAGRSYATVSGHGNGRFGAKFCRQFRYYCCRKALPQWMREQTNAGTAV